MREKWQEDIPLSITPEVLDLTRRTRLETREVRAHQLPESERGRFIYVRT